MHNHNTSSPLVPALGAAAPHHSPSAADPNGSWSQKFQIVFNSATLMFGFESFILSSYLNNFSTPTSFSDILSWAVLFIMLSLILNMYLSVLSAHMSVLPDYQPWHVLVLYTTELACGFSLIVFVVAINLLVADSNALGDGFKIAIYVSTGVAFMGVVFHYAIVWLALASTRVESFLNSISPGGPLLTS